MRKLAAVAAVMAVVSISACKKTGDGEYQVEKPVVGTQTDTIHTPTVELGTDTAKVKVAVVRAQTIGGETFELTGEDLLARAIQHETDHLNGILFLSHLSLLKRDIIRRRIRKMIKAGEWK